MQDQIILTRKEAIGYHFLRNELSDLIKFRGSIAQDSLRAFFGFTSSFMMAREFLNEIEIYLHTVRKSNTGVDDEDLEAAIDVSATAQSQLPEAADVAKWVRDIDRSIELISIVDRYIKNMQEQKP